MTFPQTTYIELLGLLLLWKGGSYWARWFQSWFRACVRETILFPHSLVSLLFTLFPICLPGYLFWEIVLSHHLFSWLSLYMGREGWSFQRSLFLTISMIFRTNLAWLHASVFCLGSFALEGFQYASHHKEALIFSTWLASKIQTSSM